jgi:hypothetical protein
VAHHRDCDTRRTRISLRRVCSNLSFDFDSLHPELHQYGHSRVEPGALKPAGRLSSGHDRSGQDTWILLNSEYNNCSRRRRNVSTTAANGSYNFGAGTTTLGDADRAAGFISSGTATMSGNLYAQFVNNTGSALSGLQISYDVEKYRNGSNPAGFRYQLFYSLDGNAWTNAGPNFFTAFPADADNSGFATAPGATVSVHQ